MELGVILVPFRAGQPLRVIDYVESEIREEVRRSNPVMSLFFRSSPFKVRHSRARHFGFPAGMEHNERRLAAVCGVYDT